MVSQSTRDLLSTTDKLFLSFAFQMPCLPKDKKKNVLRLKQLQYQKHFIIVSREDVNLICSYLIRNIQNTPDDVTVNRQLSHLISFVVEF